MANPGGLKSLAKKRKIASAYSSIISKKKLLKGRDLFFFENYAKLIFSANQIPKSPEDTDAFFRRWEIINFPNQFLQNADKKIMKKLTISEELSGFLNFAINGLKRLLLQEGEL
jgi:phage/plasmid-associated DNA primase